jgi:hypothetical protein
VLQAATLRPNGYTPKNFCRTILLDRFRLRLRVMPIACHTMAWHAKDSPAASPKSTRWHPPLPEEKQKREPSKQLQPDVRTRTNHPTCVLTRVPRAFGLTTRTDREMQSLRSAHDVKQVEAVGPGTFRRYPLVRVGYVWHHERKSDSCRRNSTRVSEESQSIEYR